MKPITFEGQRYFAASLPCLLLAGITLAGCSSTEPGPIDRDVPGENTGSDAAPGAQASLALADDPMGAFHAPGEIAIVYSETIGQDANVEVTNSSDESAFVAVQASVRGNAGRELFEIGVYELRSGESRRITVSNEEHQFTSLLKAGEAGLLTIEATLQVADGASQRALTSVYFDEAFHVKTHAEVQRLKRGSRADAAGLEAFLKAGTSGLNADRAVRSEVEVQQPETITPDPDDELPAELLATMHARFAEIPIDGNVSGRVSNALDQAAANVSGRVCVWVQQDWADDNVGEDYLLPGGWSAVGMSVWVRPEGSSTFQGPYYTGPYDGNPIGCTGLISLPSGTTPRIALQSIARVPRDYSGNMSNRINIVADDPNSGPNGYNDQFEWLPNTWQSGNNFVTMVAANPEIRATHAAATAVQLLRDGQSGVGQLPITVNATTSTGGAVGGIGGLQLPAGTDMQKFLIAHETGHWAHQSNGGIPAANNANYTETGPAACASADFNGAFGSREWMTAAFVEGFATYFAAASFNAPDPNSCKVGWPGWPGGVDCAGDGTISAKHHLTDCGGDVGHANEWDWVRMFWDLYDDVSYPTIASFLRATQTESWDKDNAYAILAHVADGHAINSAWDSHRNANGVKICQNGIPASNVCCDAGCGTCGGSGCSQRPGGSTKCCVGKINDTQGWCADGDAPCKLEAP